MTDPLESLSDPDLKAQLRKLRERVGETDSADRLREDIPGFKGQKGIYKPKGARHALWVRQTLRGVYPDQRPKVLPDGSWTYRYSPEGRKGQIDMKLDTNQSLLHCMEDRVPVGVFIQEEGTRQGSNYEIYGLAYVDSFDGTHFVLRGEQLDPTSSPMHDAKPPPFKPYEEARTRLEMSRAVRDRRFTWGVRKIYHEKCSLCKVGFRLHDRTIGLEAAHVIPVKKNGTSSDLRNGILLCRNHHALFDEWVWTFDEDYRVRITTDKEFRVSARPNHVLRLEGARLPNLPDLVENRPAEEAIQYRLTRFEQKGG